MTMLVDQRAMKRHATRHAWLNASFILLGALFVAFTLMAPAWLTSQGAIHWMWWMTALASAIALSVPMASLLRLRTYRRIRDAAKQGPTAKQAIDFDQPWRNSP